MQREQIKALALANGFKLKTQPDGSEDLNPYVYEFAAALMAPLQAELKRQQDENSRLLFANRYNAGMYRQIDDERKRLQAEVKRARLDERQAMTYLSQVRIAAEHDGDFPSLVEHVKQMAEALRAAHEMAKAAWVEGSDAGWKAARGKANDA